MICAACSGRGSIGLAECSICKGRGKLSDSYLSWDTCARCSGTARFGTGFCSTCHGIGRLPPEIADGPLLVSFEAGRHEAAHQELGPVLGALRATVRVCDPYYGTRSLANLSLLTGCQQVLFLTQIADHKEAAFIDTRVTDFVAGHPHFEFRKYSGRDLHDRFALTDKELVLFGHGLKDVGGKESFLIRLPQRIAGDVMASVKATFDTRWQQATVFPSTPK